MTQEKREHPQVKLQLHPRNKHRERYDFKLLIQSLPDLAPYVILNKYNDESIDFANPAAVKALNRALLKYYYDIDYWDIPAGYLVPPIPGRADYIHNIADVLGETNHGKIPTGENIRCLDIGVGANCVYPIVGVKEYGWSFVGTETDSVALESASKIVNENDVMKGNVEFRLQSDTNQIFQGVVNEGECFDIIICNPPFHASAAEANAVTMRKQQNLKGRKIFKSTLNFGGQNNELWCQGGEERFVANMIYESEKFASSCLWFSSLISKETNLNSVYYNLKKVQAAEVKTIEMGQGNKISRLVAWTFCTKEQQQAWASRRW